MKQHLIIALIAVAAYTLVALFVVKFDPQLMPAWFAPVLFLWFGSMIASFDGNAFWRKVALVCLVAVVAVIGAAIVAQLRIGGNETGFIYIGWFVFALIVSGVISSTRILYNENAFGSSNLATHAIALGEFVLLIITLVVVK